MAAVEAPGIGSDRLRSMRPIRVLLADDHAAFRQGIAGLLAAESTFEVVGEAANGQEAFELARELRPDVVLMDVSMPLVDGLTATRRIRAELPEVRVVMITIAWEERTRAKALQSGAAQCLSKAIDARQLCRALRETVGRPAAAR